MVFSGQVKHGYFFILCQIFDTLSHLMTWGIGEKMKKNFVQQPAKTISFIKFRGRAPIPYPCLLLTAEFVINMG